LVTERFIISARKAALNQIHQDLTTRFNEFSQHTFAFADFRKEEDLSDTGKLQVRLCRQGHAILTKMLGNESNRSQLTRTGLYDQWLIASQEAVDHLYFEKAALAPGKEQEGASLTTASNLSSVVALQSEGKSAKIIIRPLRA
jgi:hypothetical protein